MTYLPAEDISVRLTQIIADEIRQQGGWIGFDTFMAMALYTPGLGYYANDSLKFGALPYTTQDGKRVGGSDFVTAPEITPLFGQTLAAQVAQALQQTQTHEVWEFGAGTGALALQLLDSLLAQGVALSRYTIVDLSGSLRARQQHTLEKFGDLVHWVQALPDQMQGVVVGNEVLDAMPVKLLHRLQGVWHERGVVLAEPGESGEPGEPGKGAPLELVWQDRLTSWRAPIEPEGPHDYLTEIHPQGESFIRTLADKLTAGAAFFIDYGFPEHEYYHPQRSGGTVMCHQQHQADPDPLQAVGRKDITAHVNFTGVALAAQDAGLSVLGYTSQARFLINCGLAQRMESAPLATRVKAQTLIMEHEMGELFKVIGLCCGEPWQALGFAQGDRTHTL